LKIIDYEDNEDDADVISEVEANEDVADNAVDEEIHNVDDIGNEIADSGIDESLNLTQMSHLLDNSCGIPNLFPRRLLRLGPILIYKKSGVELPANLLVVPMFILNFVCPYLVPMELYSCYVRTLENFKFMILLERRGAKMVIPGRTVRCLSRRYPHRGKYHESNAALCARLGICKRLCGTFTYSNKQTLTLLNAEMRSQWWKKYHAWSSLEEFLWGKQD